ncbi:MAG: hypothetical protein IKR48_07855 [Kiritimatiellae bacterium]|nr:hypothetical protein [Kiritimatiellia bacterium]
MNTKYARTIREEELKNKIAADWFGMFDCTQILGNVDFCVTPNNGGENLLWAEAKRGTSHDIDESLVQLILTIGKARMGENHLPPKYLGAFDVAKIAFLPYHEIVGVFRQNDFNWNVAPSNHKTREFRQLLAQVKSVLDAQTLRYDFLKDGKELKQFIKANFTSDGGTELIQITKNNFTHIYGKWRETVMPTIEIPDWTKAKRNGIIDADFFLADIFSADNIAVTNRLNVLLRTDHYQQSGGKNSLGQDLFTEVRFSDGQRAHRQFWNTYKRPPLQEYWDDIMNRRDLLVPQDVRERKGSFFTPRRWVELSQEYLARELGENWQDEYYVWDCCAGTGNMEAGLVNKYRVWASTLDQADVDVMHERIKHMDESSTDGNGANLLDSHVFQFDFLNDSFDKLPADLKSIIDDPKKRRKLIIYINPPYAEAANASQATGTGEAKGGVATGNITYGRYKGLVGKAINELFAQFLMRISQEIPGCIVGQFSTLKHIQAPNFKAFRQVYRGRLANGFIVPANTFDNVTGAFPIGFFVWRLGTEVVFTEASVDVYDADGTSMGTKYIYSHDNNRFLMDWIRQFYDKKSGHLAYLRYLGSDFQNNKGVFLTSKPSDNDLKQVKGSWVTASNIMPYSIYFAVRKCIAATWLNDRDQFLYPSNDWETDLEFQSNCLVFTLFSISNEIRSKDGPNHWIPFTEQEVGAKGCFESHFMSDYLAGRHGEDDTPYQDDLFPTEKRKKITESKPISLSREAKAVMAAGRELWRYYHKQSKANPNASLYDIRLHFQGTKRTEKGKDKMNPKSSDATYMELLAKLRTAHKELARAIEPKVYEYGFLKKSEFVSTNIASDAD